jgi:hypothetical protein
MSTSNPADQIAARVRDDLFGHIEPRTDAIYAPGSRGAIAEAAARIEGRQERLAREVIGSTERAPTTAELAELSDIQSRFDPLFASIEVGAAPQPLPTEKPLAYRIRLLDHMKGFSPDRKNEALGRLAAASIPAFDEAERDILRDTQRVIDDPTQGSFRRPGQLREVKVKDESGRDVIEYRGHPLSWLSAFLPAPTVVVGFTRGHQYGCAPIEPPRRSATLPTLTVDDARQLLGDALRQEQEQRRAADINRRFPRQAA